jgi:hypothetical protein
MAMLTSDLVTEQDGALITKLLRKLAHRAAVASSYAILEGVSFL